MAFLKDNFDKEAALFLIKFNIVPMFDSKIIEREFLRSVPSNMKTHPVYKEMVNQIKANNLKEGNPAPDIEGRTPSGRIISLSDLKGKYVLLDFWASWCGPCRREMPYIKEALKISEENDNFRVLSYSIDSKEKDWVNCIESNNYKHKNWIHISTLKGWNTEAAKLFNVSAVPYTVLLNPNGEVIAFNIRGEEMVKKISNIIKGIEKQ
jgi:Peroxiredoxin